MAKQESTTTPTNIGPARITGASDPLVEFRANPQLAMHKLMSNYKRTVLGDDHVSEDLKYALDEAALEGTDAPRTNECPPQSPRVAKPKLQLAGEMTLTPNTTSRASNSVLKTSPTGGDLAWLVAAEELVHNLLSIGMPTDLAAQAPALASELGPILGAWRKRDLDRRGAFILEAAACHLIRHAQPVDLAFTSAGMLRRWHADRADRVDQVGEPDAAGPGDAASFLRRKRVVWAHRDGIGHGLLLDRFHHTGYSGVIERDTWIRGKVAEDLRAAAAYLDVFGPDGSPQAVLGVRVHAHRAWKAGVHFLPAFTPGSTAPPGVGAHHRLGGCEHCATKKVLPNTPNVSSAAYGDTATETSEVIS